MEKKQSGTALFSGRAYRMDEVFFMENRWWLVGCRARGLQSAARQSRLDDIEPLDEYNWH